MNVTFFDMDNIFEEGEIRGSEVEKIKRNGRYDEANLLEFGLYHKKSCLH